MLFRASKPFNINYFLTSLKYTPGIMLGTENIAPNSQTIEQACPCSPCLIPLLPFSFKPALGRPFTSTTRQIPFLSRSPVTDLSIVKSESILILLNLTYQQHFIVAYSLLIKMFSLLSIRDITPYYTSRVFFPRWNRAVPQLP